MDVNYAYYTSAKGFRVVGGTAAQFLKADGSVDNNTYPTTTQADSKYLTYTGATTDLSLATKNLNFTSGSISRLENGARIFKNVFQNYVVPAQTGILSFKFPQATTASTMFDVSINVYGYTNRYLGKIRVSFYKQTATQIVFNGSKAIIEGSDTFPTNVINVGIDVDGNVRINIGESTTVWSSYTTVEVERLSVSHAGYASDWSQGWERTMETDVSTYQTILNIVPDILATMSGLIGQIPNNPSLLGPFNLNDILKPGFYNQTLDANATLVRNYPIVNAGALNVYKTTTNAVVQEYTAYHTSITYKRSFYNGVWTAWRLLIDSIDGGNSFITSNTNQTGLIGDKTTSGNWIFNGTGANSLTVLRPGSTINNSIALGFDTPSMYMGLADPNTFAVGTNANLISTANRTFWVDNLGNGSFKGKLGSNSIQVQQTTSSLYNQYVGIETKSIDGNAITLGGVADTVGSYIGQVRYISNNQYQSYKTYASFIRFGNDGTTTIYGNTGLTANTTYSPTELAKIDSIGVYSRSMRTSRLGTFGTYNASETQGIWSINSGYNVDSSTTGLGTQYGLAYSYIGVGGSSINNAHQIHFTNNGVATVSVITGTGIVRANQFQKVGGTSSQFLKADGSLDNSNYFTNNGTNTLKAIDASNYNDVVDGAGKIWLGNFYSLPQATTGFQYSIGTILNINGLIGHDKTQLIFNGNNGSIQYRTSWYSNTPWSPVRTLWDSSNFNPAQYVTQTSLNTQLGSYATLAGTQTFSNTNTFTQSPIIPAGTLGTHAVNLNQLNASVPSSAQISNWNNKVDRLDNATGVGFDGGTANTPYVKHSNGTNIRVATETWTANSFAALNGDQEFTGINSFTQSPAVPFATHADDAVPFGQAEEIAQVRINDTFAEVIYKNSANDLTFDFNDFPNVRLATITCKGSNFQNIRVENMPRGATLKIMNGSASLSPIIYFDGGSNATGLGNATWAEFYRDQDSDIFKNNVNGTTII